MKCWDILNNIKIQILSLEKNSCYGWELLQYFWFRWTISTNETNGNHEETWRILLFGDGCLLEIPKTNTLLMIDFKTKFETKRQKTWNSISLKFYQVNNTKHSKKRNSGCRIIVRKWLERSRIQTSMWLRIYGAS